jgi:hypothetical protein
MTLAHIGAAASLLLFAQGAQAAPTYFDQPDRFATKRLASYLASKDCAGAVSALNEGVKAKQRDVLLAAGTMYETGLCVKQSWDRAVHFYQLADAAGNKEAVQRLASGYAVAGRDGAVALWWAAHRPGDLPRACVPQADPEQDAEGFEKALAAMPPALFKSCVYMVGVYASIRAETEFPSEALLRDVYGDVEMEFTPATGTIAWRQTARERATGVGTRNAAREKEDESRAVEHSLLNYMRKTGERTLARYQKPEGIDPAFKIRQSFSFYYDLQNEGARKTIE